jgi:hypothetical protein
MSPSAKVLVVANRTAGSPQLISALRSRVSRSPARFSLVVPAVPYGLAWAADMKAGLVAAEIRAAAGARRLRLAGLEVADARVGDPDPAAAVADALHGARFDEVFVSTFPAGVSAWLRVSLPQRLRRLTDLPVHHVVTRSGYVVTGSEADSQAAMPPTSAATSDSPSRRRRLAAIVAR